MYEYIIKSTKDGTLSSYTSDVELEIGQTINNYDQDWEILEDIS